MRILGIFFIFISIFCSCQDRKGVTEVTLSHNPIRMDSDFIVGAPIEMHCLNDILLIIDTKSERPFHWIKIPECKYMGSFGDLGQGPNELLRVRNIHSLNNTLYCYDSYKFKLFEIIPDNKSRNLSFKVIHEFDKDMTIDAFPLSPSRICKYGYFEKGMLHLADTNGKIINSTRDFPYRDEPESKLSNQLRFMAYQGCMAANGNGYIAYLTGASNQCYVYKMTDDSLKEVFVNQESFPLYTPDNTEGFSVTLNVENKLGYQDIAVDDEGFYGLYSDKSIKEYKQKAFECSSIYYYNWDGSNKTHYKLDIPILCFCYDKKHNVFYGIANNPDPVLVKFSLP